MNPLDALGAFALGIVRNHQLQNWWKLAATLVFTTLVCFPSVLGGISLGCLAKGMDIAHSLAYGFATSCSVTPVFLIRIWQVSPATRGIPFAFPQELEEQLLKTPAVIDMNKQGWK